MTSLIHVSIYLLIIVANFPFLWSVLRAVAMRTENAANYALLEDKVAELVEKRLKDLRQNGEIGVCTN